MPRIEFVLAFCLCTCGIASADDWLAGSARANITPERPIQMAGYGSRNLPADGKLTDLWAKALVLEDGSGHRGMLITLDLVGIHRDTATRICDRLRQERSLQRDQIVINCSHTHSGPVVGQNLAPLHYLLVSPPQQKLLDDYESALVKKVVAVAGQAIDDLEPCTVTRGNGSCSFAVNRRENPAATVNERREWGTLVGPYDHDVPVLVVRAKDRIAKTILFGYACHATVLNGRQWSGDYPGYAQIALEERYPYANAMFWAGCGADQNPLPRREVQLAKSYGDRLASAVREVIEGTMTPVAATLQTRMEQVDLPLADVPPIQEVSATAARSEQKYEKARAEYLLARVDDSNRLPESYRYPIATWRLGTDLRFVFLGGEVVVDYALAIKDSSRGGGSVWVAGYSNDVMAYIPSRRVLREGGYEGGGSNVYYGLPGTWSPLIEKQILSQVELQAGHRE